MIVWGISREKRNYKNDFYKRVIKKLKATLKKNEYDKKWLLTRKITILI